jgi:hypothetical protein
MTDEPQAPASAPAPPPIAANDILCPEAEALVVSEEVTGQAYYSRHYVHFEWPLGASGPTVAIGYDCGYVTAAEVRADWAGIVDQATIDALVRAVGLRGDAAHSFVQQHANSVTILWDQAMAEFRQREVPKWFGRCRAVLPGFDAMPAKCRGAIFSLSYNRGTGGYDDPSPRDAEMRAVKAMIKSGHLTGIPDEIRSMRRLWASGGDLWRRRGHEADLFAAGLVPDSVPAQGAVTAAPKV